MKRHTTNRVPSRHRRPASPVGGDGATKTTQPIARMAPAGEARHTPGSIRRGAADAAVAGTSGSNDAVRFEGTEAMYRTLIDGMSEGAVAVSPEGTVLFCNRQFARLVRLPLDRVVGAPFASFVAPANGADLMECLHSVRERLVRIDALARITDGESIPLKLAMQAFVAGDRRAVSVVAADLSGTRQLGNARVELEDRLAELAVSTRDLLNSRTAALNMMEDAVEARRDLEQMNDQLRREIAERKEAEAAVDRLAQQFRQAQKMEAIGRLAGGIAHDFNNVLTAILGYSDLILDKAEPGSDLASDVNEIRAAGERAARLTQQLLAFSRKQMVAPRFVAVNDVLAGMKNMLRLLIGEDVQLNMSLGSDLHVVRGDPGLIEQVVMNLVVNARDAMPDGGTLAIHSSNRTLDAEFVRTHVGSVAGEHVAIVVTDSGSGMPPEVIDYIFEPFFTTKASGKGTGLGLSTVYGIVKQSNGYIAVDSTVGRGTTFTILLPRAVGSAEEAWVNAPIPKSSDGTETVLVVEDEALVRNLIRRTLEPRGYAVLLAESPDQAMAIDKSFKGPIDLLLTDIVMPEMNGSALCSAIRTHRPAMRVLFISGFVDHTAVDLVKISQAGAFLQKPFTGDVLAAKVRQLIDWDRTPD